MNWQKLLRRQPTCNTCGPCSLRHALLLLGVQTSVKRISKLAGLEPRGTDEKDLRRAAKKLGFDLKELKFTDSDAFKKASLYYLQGNTPALLCVDRDSEDFYIHWICAMHADARHVWIADSSWDRYPVLRRYTWREYLQRACVWRSKTLQEFYLYIVVKPKRRPK